MLTILEDLDLILGLAALICLPIAVMFVLGVLIDAGRGMSPHREDWAESFRKDTERRNAEAAAKKARRTR